MTSLDHILHCSDIHGLHMIPLNRSREFHEYIQFPKGEKNNKNFSLSQLILRFVQDLCNTGGRKTEGKGKRKGGIKGGKERRKGRKNEN